MDHEPRGGMIDARGPLSTHMTIGAGSIVDNGAIFMAEGAGIEIGRDVLIGRDSVIGMGSVATNISKPHESTVGASP